MNGHFNSPTLCEFVRFSHITANRSFWSTARPVDFRWRTSRLVRKYDGTTDLPPRWSCRSCNAESLALERFCADDGGEIETRRSKIAGLEVRGAGFGSLYGALRRGYHDCGLR